MPCRSPLAGDALRSNSRSALSAVHGAKASPASGLLPGCGNLSPVLLRRAVGARSRAMLFAQIREALCLRGTGQRHRPRAGSYRGAGICRPRCFVELQEPACGRCSSLKFEKRFVCGAWGQRHRPRAGSYRGAGICRPRCFVELQEPACGRCSSLKFEKRFVCGAWGKGIARERAPTGVRESVARAASSSCRSPLAGDAFEALEPKPQAQELGWRPEKAGTFQAPGRRPTHSSLPSTRSSSRRNNATTQSTNSRVRGDSWRLLG